MKIVTIGDSLYWSYANLGMAHAALHDSDTAYYQKHYIIRNRLYSGFRKGTISIGALAEDERLKLAIPRSCCYCGSENGLTIDHLLPTSKGGKDGGENMVWACRSCNSSKGATDMLVWLKKKEQFPSILLLRRYLKLSIEHCLLNGAQDTEIAATPALPFSLADVPHSFPSLRSCDFGLLTCYEHRKSAIGAGMGAGRTRTSHVHLLN